MPDSLLRWKNLRVTFPSLNSSVPSETSLIPDGEIQENDFVWINGPSGAGKSTLMHLIKGIIPRYIFARVDGEFTYRGQDLIKSYPFELDRNTVYVFQNLYSQMVTPRAKEELIFGMENFHFSREQIKRGAQLWAEKFKLTSLLEQKTYTLSGGQCQRLVLASSLACAPKILLFDEPTAFMDPETQKDFYQLLAWLKGKFTIIVIDHHVPELSQLCDKNISWPAQPQQNAIHLPPVPSSPLLSLSCRNLFFSYPGKNIFEKLSIDFKPKKIIAIVGANGSGKTTFLKLLSRMEFPVSGEIQFQLDGQNISAKQSYDHMSIIYQNSESQFYFDTVREELSFKSSHLELVLQLAQLLGLEKTLDRSPYMLSEGQKRRLSILIAIAQEKPLIMYDEPTYGQDKNNVSLITQLILKLKQAGRLQILITHDFALAKQIADEIYSLENKTLVKL